MEQLYLFLKQMKKEDYEGYLSRIQSFLISTAAKKFTQEALNESFCNAILRSSN
jgi:hypothetical protein